MLVVYRRTDGAIASNSGTNSNLPDGPAFEAEVQNAIRKLGGTAQDYGEYRLNDNESAETVAAILASGSYDLTFDEAGQPSGVIIYERLAVVTDKAQIVADGVDTATVTVMLPDGAEDGEVIFEVNGEQAAVTTTVNRMATLEFSSAEAGVYGIEAISARHGRAGVEVRAE
ncbi:MAG: hypothetical protein HPY55_06520 [Firmicutes bacterium]|nr:hypothetical protein [Bacillota bacterium]